MVVQVDPVRGSYGGNVKYIFVPAATFVGNWAYKSMLIMVLLS